MLHKIRQWDLILALIVSVFLKQYMTVFHTVTSENCALSAIKKINYIVFSISTMQMTSNVSNPVTTVIFSDAP